MVEIANGIKEAICLEFIDLRHNHFEQQGFKALINALKATMACKVLQLEGFQLGIEEAKMLRVFLENPDCALNELDLHQAELTYDVMAEIHEGLKTCNTLKAISYSKNNFGIDYFVDSDDSEMSDVGAVQHPSLRSISS